MGGEITMYVTIAVSLVFGVLYVVCILMFFGQAGIMVAVLVAVLVFMNTGKMKEWTKEERRLEEEHRRALSEKEGD